ncbi:MAG: Sulfotransferase family [Hydrocarboniphaga sp.]|uniref:sulfotransferase family 2 domain-containing protein n=1 Tax=Hydrocarboniphaga sp. TaxID=2033016 RepID=UPI00261221F3|nr:sulfotransferase family 2 domain-containing protein [Hydrocarboniphaga sp.]MDB5973192.1 Sulfotransferase family [Hydrocarboniphaga sp.]
MIISHKHQYIFFAIPKTGTHSVRQALRLHAGDQDLEQVGLFVQKRFPFPEFAGIRHGHISARQIRPVLGDATFNQYLKFAFVRNPYERFVSYCAFMTRSGDEFKIEPRAVMKHVISSDGLLAHLLCRPQHEFIVDDTGHVAMDYVGRNETMQLSYDIITDRLGLPKETLTRANSSEHRPWPEYYDRDLIDSVGKIYRRDLELFGYEFDRHAS